MNPCVGNSSFRRNRNIVFQCDEDDTITLESARKQISKQMPDVIREGDEVTIRGVETNGRLLLKDAAQIHVMNHTLQKLHEANDKLATLTKIIREYKDVSPELLSRVSTADLAAIQHLASEFASVMAKEIEERAKTGYDFVSTAPRPGLADHLGTPGVGAGAAAGVVDASLPPEKIYIPLKATTASIHTSHAAKEAARKSERRGSEDIGGGCYIL